MIQTPALIAPAPAPQDAGAEVRALLSAHYSPARQILAWDGDPIQLPGFQVRRAPDAVLVRFVEGRAGIAEAQRSTVAALLARYRQTLEAAGWLVTVLDAPGRSLQLRCQRPMPDERAHA